MNFLLMAAVIHIGIVHPMNVLRQRRRQGGEPRPAEPTDVGLLTQIRDLLAAGPRADGGGGQPRS